MVRLTISFNISNFEGQLLFIIFEKKKKYIDIVFNKKYCATENEHTHTHCSTMVIDTIEFR